MSFVIGILKTCAPKLVDTTIIVMTVVPIEHFDSIQPTAIGKIIPIPAPARPVPKINHKPFSRSNILEDRNYSWHYLKNQIKM